MLVNAFESAKTVIYAADCRRIEMRRNLISHTPQALQHHAQETWAGIDGSIDFNSESN